MSSENFTQSVVDKLQQQLTEANKTRINKAIGITNALIDALESPSSLDDERQRFNWNSCLLTINDELEAILASAEIN